MNVAEALVHPEPHIRAQAQIVLECPDVNTEKERERLWREIKEYDEYIERSKN